MLFVVKKLLAVAKFICYGALCVWLIVQIKLGAFEILLSKSQNFIEAVNSINKGILILTTITVGLECLGNLIDFFTKE